MAVYTWADMDSTNIWDIEHLYYLISKIFCLFQFEMNKEIFIVTLDFWTPLYVHVHVEAHWGPKFWIRTENLGIIFIVF